MNLQNIAAPLARSLWKW